MDGGVVVKVVNGDSELFRNADDYKVSQTDWLFVLRAEKVLGTFPPGSWHCARHMEGHAPNSGRR